MSIVRFCLYPVGMSPLVMSSAFMAILDGRDRIGRDSRTESCGTPQDVEDGLHMAMPPRKLRNKFSRRPEIPYASSLWEICSWKA